MTKLATNDDRILLHDEYKTLLKEIKSKVKSSQFKAAVAVNYELIKSIGK